jgi:Holliday junction resolvase
MNIPAKSLLDEKIDSLASIYTQDGFEVQKEPSADQLPFDLGGYKPDLLARKENTGLIIEVKTNASHYSVDRFQLIAQEISKHPGWRFLLVTLEDVDSGKIPITTSELPTWQQLETKLTQAQALIEEGAFDPGLLYLWSIFEAALRKQAIAQNIPVERLPAKMLLNHMYSHGEVSIEQFDLFREFRDKRNRITHGANELIDPDMVRKLLISIRNLLAEWSGEDH